MVTTTTSAFVVSVLAVAVGFVLYNSNTNNWHDGPKWERFLSMYDERAAIQFADCDSRLIKSRFGSTQIHACGSPTDPPVFLLHGASDSSLLYGDWLVPDLVRTAKRYVVAIDTMCDIGRSRPEDGLLQHCPKGREEIVEWAMDVKSQLLLPKSDNDRSYGTPISIVGYSYGGFISSQITLGSPRGTVDKLVLLSPAATVAPFQMGWLLRGLVFDLLGGLVNQERLTNWFFRYMNDDETCRTKFDDMIRSSHADWQLRIAADEAGRPKFLEIPDYVGENGLKALNEITRGATMLIIGEAETVTDPKKSIENAQRAGIRVKTYEQVGHLINTEYSREPIVRDVVDFLSS